jgi:hypothetical protein
VPLLLSEGCLVLLAKSGHYAFQFTSVFTRHSSWLSNKKL